LANFQPKAGQPGESAWAELREAQALALSEPQTGMAVLIDAGETKDIHPRNKHVAGDRLAAIALARDYGQSIPWTGPVFDSVAFDGSKAIVTFKTTGGSLIAQPLPQAEMLQSASHETTPLVLPRPGSEVQGFALCGADRKWKWADAKIRGETVVVSSPEVPAPVAVRYAWSDNPTCNLASADGFPASPFRSDTFPASTLANKF
jgi:sialate O-acetylesterase